MPRTERLSGLDAAFLYAEDATAHMHVGAVAVFEGRSPAHEELLRHVEGRLDRLPRWRQRVVFPPLGLDRPSWEEEAWFDLPHHVRHTALPQPAGEAQLATLASRVFGQRLDRERPLWELWLVDALAGDRFALILKAHHCMVDGVAGVHLAGTLFDPGPVGREQPRSPEASAVRGAPAPGSGTVADSAVTSTAAPGAAAAPVPSSSELGQALSRPFERLRQALVAGAGGRAALAGLGAVAAPLAGLGLMGRAPPSSLNRPIGPHRRWLTAALDLAAVKAVRAALGGTVNDVVMAVVAGALRALFAARGEPPPALLRVMVPVSVRPPGAAAAGSLGNRVSALFCDLPVGEAEPARRHARVVEEMQRRKASGQALGALAWTRLGDVAFAPLLAVVSRYQAGHRYINLVVTNIPGPQEPLYLLGRRMTGWYPLVPLAQEQTLGVAVESYHGRLGFGLVADAGNVPEAELQAFARAVPDAFAELEDLAAAAAAAAVAR